MKSISESPIQKTISFRKLLRQTIPETWMYQIYSSCFLTFVSYWILLLINEIADYGGTAITSANISDFLTTWRAPALLLLGFILVALFIVFEIFAMIFFSSDILDGKPAGVLSEIKKALDALPRFLTRRGLLILLFIFIAIPLGGIGLSIFSISLTNTLYVPDFIMEVIKSVPFYRTVFYLMIALMSASGFRHIFSIHGVLLDGLTPKEAILQSNQIIRLHWKNFIFEMIRLLLILEIVYLGASFLFQEFPEWFLDTYQDSFSSRFLARSLDALALFLGYYLCYTVSILTGAVNMLYLTRLYRRYTRGEETEWLERPKKLRYRLAVFFMFLFILLFILYSLIMAFSFDRFFEPDHKVNLIAHRAGGELASENSIDGLKEAIKYGCYGSETDVQRTKDGYYIINHDNTFSRLAGVDKTPSEMTLQEIRNLTLSGGQTVPTIEEMLDTIKGKEILFIELKGSTADRQMADDLLQIIREKNCLDNVVLISLKYDVINYIESTYPEVETGVLCFASIGELTNLNCDDLIIEEEMATFLQISNIHLHDKKAIVWTVNDETSLRQFLFSSADAVITDQIQSAVRIQREQSDRNDFEIMKDTLSTILVLKK